MAQLNKTSKCVHLIFSPTTTRQVITLKSFDSLSYLGQTRRLRRLALHAIEEHGLRPAAVRLMGHGENTTYRVDTDSSTYLCRIHRLGYQTPRSIASELDWLHALQQETRLVVPQPVLSAGEPVPIFQLDGLDPRPVVLFHWTHGRFEIKRPRVVSLKKTGRFLAELHNHAASWTPPSTFIRQRWDLEGLTGRNLGGSLRLIPESHRRLVDEVVSKVSLAFDRLGDAAMLLIHADLHGANRLLTRAGSLAAIDFDDCGVGHVSYDLAVTLSYLRSEPHYDALHRALLSGYREVRALSDEQERAIADFFALRRLHIWLWVLSRMADHPTFRDRAPGVTARAVRLLSDYVAGTTSSPATTLRVSIP